MSPLFIVMLNILIITLAASTVVLLLIAIWLVLREIREVARDQEDDQ